MVSKTSHDKSDVFISYNTKNFLTEAEVFHTYYLFQADILKC